MIHRAGGHIGIQPLIVSQNTYLVIFLFHKNNLQAF